MDDYPLELRQLMASRTQQFVQELPDQFPVVRPAPYNINYHPNSSSVAVGRHHHHQVNNGLFDQFAYAAPPPPPPPPLPSSFSAILNGSSSTGVGSNSLFGLELMNNHEHGWNNIDGSAGGNNSRWPRQETLALLEIRSGLDSKFKDTNQKGPLWDEVSRIMSEEHGYMRSGKKCKEKFENLYKYYKKTKEGKAGRQDGKHYRFFRQLEAIYGTTSITANLVYNYNKQEEVVNKLGAENLSFSNNSSTDLEGASTNSDDLSNSYTKKTKTKTKTWKVEVEEYVNAEMTKVMKAQERWMEKLLKTIQGKEEERLAKEEEWRKREVERFSQQVHEFWAKERAWVETRDASVMAALSQITKANNKELSMDGVPAGLLLPSSSNHSSFYIPSTNQGESLWKLTK